VFCSGLIFNCVDDQLAKVPSVLSFTGVVPKCFSFLGWSVSSSEKVHAAGSSG
jgi:hypothetical protein